LCEALWNDTAMPEIYADLSVSYFRLSTVETGVQAEQYRKKAIEMGMELCRRYPAVAIYQRYLYEFLNA